MDARRAKPLTILHVGTINKPITRSNGYAPIETVIYNIDKGLTALGHRSIVACSADSSVAGEHYRTVPESLGDYCLESTGERQARVDLHLRLALERAEAGDIDVVHMHEWLERLWNGSFNPAVPVVTTLHVPGAHCGIRPIEGIASPQHPRGASTRRWVAISDFQRRQYDGLVPVSSTVPHGLDLAEVAWSNAPSREAYLLSIGRITSDKGQDTAIEVARRSGRKLVIAGCVQNKPQDRAYFAQLQDSFDQIADVSHEPVTPDYFERVMQPLLRSSNQVIYVGELQASATLLWYRHAAATLFPIRWGEPFGMVLIESMACGTPVIAFPEGAVPEIVKDGETGFIVDSLEAMVSAVGKIGALDRSAVRRYVEGRFSLERMTENYVTVYEAAVAARDAKPMAPRATREIPAIKLAPVRGRPPVEANAPAVL